MALLIVLEFDVHTVLVVLYTVVDTKTQHLDSDGISDGKGYFPLYQLSGTDGLEGLVEMGDDVDYIKISHSGQPLRNECLLLYALNNSHTSESIHEIYKVRSDKSLVVKGIVTNRK